MDTNLARTLRLLLIADHALFRGRDPVSLCRAAVDGGVTAVQLRWKGGAARDVAALAGRLREALAVPVFVNDRTDVALAVRAAGVHLGADDLRASVVRRIAPPGFVVGASVGDAREAADSAGADYVGIGPWRETATKADAGAALGAAGVRRLLALVGDRPAVVIGGVRGEDAAEVRALGVAGVAVGSGILGADDVTAAARAFVS
jgi:thiamine-phosphate diphosphorylase